MSGCVVMKFQSAEKWAVEKNDSLFSPIFNEYLNAMIFAEVYQRMDWTAPDKWTESAQASIASDIAAFIEAKMPEGKRNQREVPAEWKDAIHTAKYHDDDDTETECAKLKLAYDYQDLVDDVDASWRTNTVNVLDMVVDWFYEWKK